LFVLVLLAVAAASGAAPAPPGAPAVPPAAATAKQPNWYPLEVGHEWQYQVTGELVVSAPGQPPMTEPIDSDSEMRIERVVTEFGTPTSEVLLIGWTDLAANELLTTLKLYVAATPGGVFVHARRLEDAEGSDAFRKYAPPRRMLMLPAKAGAKWAVGVDDLAGVKETTTAEILGFEAVTVPAGSFAGCLKFRETGKLTGKVDLPTGGALQIETGLRTLDAWLADGVGQVKGIEKYNFTIKEPSGLKATIKVTLTRDLTFHRTPQD